jgi:alpha-galactosidase/6-phospho-beta-glucosidase family protein
MDYVSPFDERVREPIAPAPRPADLHGATVALLDINKARGAEFLDRVEELLHEHGAQTIRVTKPAFSRPAPAELIEEVARGADLVVEALAD